MMKIKNLVLATAAALTIGVAGASSAKADWYGHGPGYGPPGYHDDHYYGGGDWHRYGYFDPYRSWHFYPGFYGVVPRYYVPPPVYYAPPPPRYYAPPPVYVGPPVVTFGIRP